jgi:hypothetical protein
MPVDDFPDDNAPSDINACWLDLTAAHSHVVAAADTLGVQCRMLLCTWHK